MNLIAYAAVILGGGMLISSVPNKVVGWLFDIMFSLLIIVAIAGAFEFFARLSGWIVGAGTYHQ